MEVPTVLTPTRIAVQTAEQIVGTTVPRGRARGSLPGQSSAARRPAQSSRRRFSGRICHMPAAGLHGYIESDSWVPRAVFPCLSASSPTTVAVHGWFYW